MKEIKVSEDDYAKIRAFNIIVNQYGIEINHTSYDRKALDRKDSVESGFFVTVGDTKRFITKEETKALDAALRTVRDDD